MSDWVLIVTHALAFVAGGGTTWLVVRRKVRVRKLEDGHVALELCPHGTHND